MDFLGSMIEVECNTLLIWKGRFGAEVDWTPKFKDAFPKVQLPLLCLRDVDRKLCDALSPSYQMLKLGRWDGCWGNQPSFRCAGLGKSIGKPGS